MGKEDSREAGALSHANDPLLQAWVGEETDETSVLCSYRHTARRFDGGVERAIESIAKPYSGVLPSFLPVRMGRKGDCLFPSVGKNTAYTFFIVDGVPHSCNPETECFNPIIKTLELPEILGANIHERIYQLPWLNKERAYVQLITKLLGVEFDSIWRRHRRMLIRQIVMWIIGAVAIFTSLVAVWYYNQPVDIQLSLQEKSVKNKFLPPLHDAVVTLTLGEENKTDTISSLADKASFLHIPHRYIGKEAHITISCLDYLPVDTTMKLQSNTEVNIFRDPTVYGNIQFKLWNIRTESYVGNTAIRIGDISAVSDTEGIVKMTVPLAKQRKEYRLSSTVPLEDSVLYMPYGKDCVIRTK